VPDGQQGRAEGVGWLVESPVENDVDRQRGGPPSAASGDLDWYLLIGAHALAVHAEPRATGDLDVWVANDDENARRVYAALTRFGAPPEGIAVADCMHPEDRDQK